jgi:hypothetical protein
MFIGDSFLVGDAVTELIYVAGGKKSRDRDEWWGNR